MGVSGAIHETPDGSFWAAFGWSDWYPLVEALCCALLTCPDHRWVVSDTSSGRTRADLHIGQTGRSLRGRFGQLRTSTRRAAGGLDARAPHVVGACVYQHERRGGVIEVSWVAIPDLEKRERLGREVDLITAYRRDMGESPSCQFAGLPCN